MSSIIHRSDFEFENRQSWPTKFQGTEIPQTAAKGNGVTSNQIQAKRDAQAINRANRNQDILTLALSVFIVFLIIANFIYLLGYLFCAIQMELSRYSLEDLMRAIRGY